MPQTLVRVAGIEPACPFEREILSLLCLPISPYSHLVEDQGVEPCERITTLYRLAICCITILPIFLNLVRPERIKLPLHRS